MLPNLENVKGRYGVALEDQINNHQEISLASSVLWVITKINSRASKAGDVEKKKNRNIKNCRKCIENKYYYT